MDSVHPSSSLPASPIKAEDAADFLLLTNTALGLQTKEVEKSKLGFVTLLVFLVHAQRFVCDPYPTLLWRTACTQGSYSSLFQKMDGSREHSAY